MQAWLPHAERPPKWCPALGARPRSVEPFVFLAAGAGSAARGRTMIDERDEEPEEGTGGEGASKKRRSTKQVIEAVTGFAAPIVAAAGAWLDRVEFKEAGRRSLLQVY